jgi:hypothetical protein
VMGSRIRGQPSVVGAGEVAVSNEAMEMDFTSPVLPRAASGQ